jgi:hypothetical protein
MNGQLQLHTAFILFGAFPIEIGFCTEHTAVLLITSSPLRLTELRLSYYIWATSTHFFSAELSHAIWLSSLFSGALQYYICGLYRVCTALFF